MSLTDIGWRDGDFVLSPGGHPQIVEGVEVVRQDLLARLNCPPGRHWAYLELGVDLLQYVQGEADPLTLLALRQDAEIGVEQDTRVLFAEATLERPDLRTSLIHIRATLTDRAVVTLSTTLGGPYA